MKVPLIRRLSISFFVTVICSILITSLISNYMIDKRFNEYLSNEHKRKITKVISLVKEIYAQERGLQNVASYRELARVAILEDLYIEIKNPEGKVFFSSGRDHLLHKKMMGHMPPPMMGMGWRKSLGQYMEENYSLTKDGKTTGTLIIGYFGQWNLTERDVGFKDTLNQAFLISITAALIFGLMMSILLSKQLTTPLIKLTGIANEMREGNLTVRADADTNTLEIDQLSKAMNHLAETLQQQEMLRKRLTTDMAHEIRTPLTTLKSHMEAFIDGVWEPTEERFADCYEEVERLTKLVGNLQNLAKLEQATLQLNKETFDLSQEIIKITEVMEPQFRKKNIPIELNLIQELQVLMDRDKIKQILFNLLSNAYKYTHEGGRVEIMLRKEDKGVVLAIKDNGMGISEKDLPYIFERFYRGDVSRSRETGGAGIGLAIVKTLVEAHGGKIKAESTLGMGSTFTITFPENILPV